MVPQALSLYEYLWEAYLNLLPWNFLEKAVIFYVMFIIIATVIIDLKVKDYDIKKKNPKIQGMGSPVDVR